MPNQEKTETISNEVLNWETNTYGRIILFPYRDLIQVVLIFGIRKLFISRVKQ